MYHLEKATITILEQRKAMIYRSNSSEVEKGLCILKFIFLFSNLYDIFFYLHLVAENLFVYANERIIKSSFPNIPQTLFGESFA